VAGLSAALFTVLSFSTTQSLLGASTDDQPVSRVAQAIAFNIIGILIVGLLSARLAERRRIGEELRYTEESFADLHILHERIVDSIGSGLMTTDLEGRIFAFNRAAERISGLDAGKVIGMSIFSIFDDVGRRSIENALSGFRENRSLPATFETGFEIGDANDVVIECAAVPLLSKNGSRNGLIVTFQDITKIRVLEETVRRSDRLAAVGRMAAGLAHEIRNPLGSMSSALQFLNERTRPATEEASLMNVVLRESDRLNSIITNFLAYARPSANGFDARTRASTDVCEALRDCLALLTHSPEISEHHGFDISIPDEQMIVGVNETLLKQVFWNLLRNAVAAMPGGGTLSVSIEKDSQTKIHILDTGTGIAPGEIEHLFEPFAEGSTGTGLGLSIVHKIVSDHGGSIDVESEFGKGTHFVIELPNQQ
jgi:two-component system sensor histidine kinase PilS (NtrC family)